MRARVGPPARQSSAAWASKAPLNGAPNKAQMRPWICKASALATVSVMG
jgi:hypothetical protein